MAFFRRTAEEPDRGNSKSKGPEAGRARLQVWPQCSQGRSGGRRWGGYSKYGESHGGLWLGKEGSRLTFRTSVQLAGWLAGWLAITHWPCFAPKAKNEFLPLSLGTHFPPLEILLPLRAPEGPPSGLASNVSPYQRGHR